MIDKRAIRTSDGAREIIQYNRTVLYHLPKKYKNLDAALQSVRDDLFTIMKFCMKPDPVIWNQNYTWFIDNGNLTRERRKTTKKVSNTHFNYLCCIGAITKHKQTSRSMTGVNMTFLLNNPGKRPMNTFSIHKYTEKKLDEMEQRAAELREHKITPGNINCDKLKASGLQELAERIYYLNSKKTIDDKTERFEIVLEHLEKLCEKGYTNKKELCSSLNTSRDKLDKLLNIFKEQWQQLYEYKAPNKQDKEKYNITSKSWIITRR